MKRKHYSTVLILLTLWLLLLVLINVTHGHGTHMSESSGPIIGQKNIGFGQTVWYLDYNHNDKPDYVKVIAFIKNEGHPRGIFHILFSGTYPLFIKEYGEEHSYWRGWEAK